MINAEVTRAPRCANTLLTKPECHCPACLSEQIAAHSPAAEPGATAAGMRQAAA